MAANECQCSRAAAEDRFGVRSFGGLQLRREAIGFNACLTAVGLVGHWPQMAALLAEMRGVAVVPTEVLWWGSGIGWAGGCWLAVLDVAGS